MNAKVHIHMHVSDLAKSRAFYAAFFGDQPVKVKPGYVKFLPALGPVNLALSEGPATGSTHEPVSHLGIQVDSPDVVQRELARVKAAGLPVREEMGVTCCHANQDKFWVEDPDGVEWEVYHLNHDVDEEDSVDSQPAASLPLAPSVACCAPTCCGGSQG